MTHDVADERRATPTVTNPRAEALAARLEHGAQALAAFARGLTMAQWQTRLLDDGRTIGVVVHHVASVYPVEIQLAQKLATGEAIAGVTRAVIDAMNAAHARTYAAVTKDAALELLVSHSTAAAAAIRALSDNDLAQAAPVSLYGDAPLTCQFMLEDHAVRHSYHHLASLRAALSDAEGL